MLWSLPAVSIIAISAPLDWAATKVSKTTAPGSEPWVLLTISAPALFAHSSSCSMAAALKVSPAPKITFFPSFTYLEANFPIVVVFPTPFTPTTKITFNFPSSMWISLFSFIKNPYITSLSTG